MVLWADPEGVARAVRAHADALRERDVGVTKILWYGSWISGTATPGSDVDLCVVLKEDTRPPRDRVPAYLPDRFPTGIDLVVLTEAELAALESRAPEWHRAIMAGQPV